MSRPLTTTEAAALTDPPTTRFTVEREIGRGNLEAVKAGGRWIIDEDEARRWAAQFRKHAGNRRPHDPSPGS